MLHNNSTTGPVRKRAVVLLSGGMDSAVTFAFALRDGYECFTLSIDYGQTNRFEIDVSRRLSEMMGAKSHLVLNLDLKKIGGSALLGDGEIPKGEKETQVDDIPATYVPARNIIFLSLAIAWAEALGAEAVFIGANAIDYSGYPDCRQEFIDAFGKVVEVGTKSGVRGSPIKVMTPLINMKKSEIVRVGHDLGVDFSLTTSCYQPAVNGKPCGECASCLLRKKAFREAGIPDPLDYTN